MHITTEQLEEKFDYISASPKNEGSIDMICRRPAENERDVVEVGNLDTKLGLIGDNWSTKGSSSMPDKSSNPEMQLNLMNSRVIHLVAGSKDRWKLAGDQFFVDLDLSPDNLPPGTQLSLGDAIIEVTPVPHLGCKKFVERFGKDAMKYINSKVGRRLNMRGINAKVVKSGTVNAGSIIKKL